MFGAGLLVRGLRRFELMQQVLGQLPLPETWRGSAFSGELRFEGHEMEDYDQPQSALAHRHT